MDRPAKQAILIVAIAFCIRLLGAVVTTLTDLNPDSRHDAVVFGTTARAIARGIREGRPYLYTPNSIELSQLIVPLTRSSTIELWGTFLAPLWLIPGPSAFYARLGNAFLAAFAIYNVYVVARHYHSHQAGVVAVVPMIVYPSFVAVQTTLLREAIILFGITTAARLLIVPPRRSSRWLSGSIAIIALHTALLHRPDNAIIYAAAVTTALTMYAVESGFITKRALTVGGIVAGFALVVSLPVIRNGVDFLARTRELRAGGRAEYLSGTVPRTVLEFVAFSWVGAAYFLYAPFPWMIETIPDLLVSVEGMLNICFTLAAAWGVRTLGRKNLPVTVGLLVGLTLAVILYGAGTVNYGTGMRHRQMFLWVIFLFGGIGLSERVRFTPLFVRGLEVRGEPNADNS